MKALVRLEIQEYMDMYPRFEHRVINADNLEESLKKVREHVEYMNTNWSGGVYSNEIKVLTQMEALQFANSNDVNPDCKEELIQMIRNDYYNDGLYDYDPDEPYYQR